MKDRSLWQPSSCPPQPSATVMMRSHVTLRSWFGHVTGWTPGRLLGGCAHPGHDEVMKWKHFPCYWPFARGIHRSPVNSPHKGQWCGALMFTLICAWINGWVNNREAADLRHHHAHYDVIIMSWFRAPSSYVNGFHFPTCRTSSALDLVEDGDTLLGEGMITL